MMKSSFLSLCGAACPQAVCIVGLLALLVVISPAPGQEHELLYVGNNHGGTVSVISVPEFELIGQFDGVPDLADRETWPVSKRVDDLVAPSSGEVLYISRPQTRDIAAMSTATEKLLWRLPTPGQPDHFTLSADGMMLYVSLANESSAIAIDVANRAIVGRIPTAPQPHGIVVSPDGQRVYIGCLTGDQITIADAKTFEVLRTIQFDNGVRPFVITPNETKLYLQLSKLHGFLEFDLEANRISKIIPLPNPSNIPAQQAYPHTAHHGLALALDDRLLAAVATVEGYTAILTVPNLDLVATIPTGTEPSWVIASLDGDYVYVSARKSNGVFIISLRELRLVKHIPVGDYPQRMWTTKVPRRSVESR